MDSCTHEVISALGKWGQEDQKFQVTLSYLPSSSPAWASRKAFFFMISAQIQRCWEVKVKLVCWAKQHVFHTQSRTHRLAVNSVQVIAIIKRKSIKTSHIRTCRVVAGILKSHAIKSLKHKTEHECAIYHEYSFLNSLLYQNCTLFTLSKWVKRLWSIRSPNIAFCPLLQQYHIYNHT